MNKIISTIISISFLLSANLTKAEITIGRNGGGLPEMQFLTLSQYNESIAQLCLSQSQICKLPDFLQKNLQFYHQFLNSNHLLYSYDYLNNLVSYDSKSQLITLDQNLLYDQFQKPLSTNEIAKLSFLMTYLAIYHQTEIFSQLKIINLIKEIIIPIDFISAKEIQLTNHITIEILTNTQSDISDSIILSYGDRQINLATEFSKIYQFKNLKILNMIGDENKLNFEIQFEKLGQKYQGLILYFPDFNQDISYNHHQIEFQSKLIQIKLLK